MSLFIKPTAMESRRMNARPYRGSKEETFRANTTQLKDRNALEFSVILFAGFLLAINAGYINGVTLSGYYGIPVSHLT